MKRKNKTKTNWRTTDYNDGVNIQQSGLLGSVCVFPDSNGHINSVVANRKGRMPKPVKNHHNSVSHQCDQ